MPIVYKRQNL